MLKKQEKALQWVIKNIKKADPAHDVLCNLIYTKDYIYATDRYCAFRLPNDTGKVSSADLETRYPKNSIDKFLEYHNSPRTNYQQIPFEITEENNLEGLELYKIGIDYYQQKYIKKAVQVLGDNIEAMQSANRHRMLYISSPKGEAAICPVRVY